MLVVNQSTGFQIALDHYIPVESKHRQIVDGNALLHVFRPRSSANGNPVVAAQYFRRVEETDLVYDPGRNHPVAKVA